MGLEKGEPIIPKEERERIDKPAILYKGEMFLGTRRHAQAIEALKGKYPHAKSKEGMFGFQTESGKFVTLSEARVIAERAGQINERGKKAPTDMLSTDDLIHLDELDKKNPQEEDFGL